LLLFIIRACSGITAIDNAIKPRGLQRKREGPAAVYGERLVTEISLRKARL
jgi:hypothetical protein